MSNGNPQQIKTNTMAILSLVFAFVLPPLGAIFGHVSMGQIRRMGEEGRGLALGGIIVGWVFTALWTLYFVFIIVFIAIAASA